MSDEDPRDQVKSHADRAGWSSGLPESIAAVAWAIVALADAVKELKSK